MSLSVYTRMHDGVPVYQELKGLIESKEKISEMILYSAIESVILVKR